jgi:hypothetical protein
MFAKITNKFEIQTKNNYYFQNTKLTKIDFFMH